MKGEAVLASSVSDENYTIKLIENPLYFMSHFLLF